MACFIVFEGGDGSGKSTQVSSLVRRLRRRNINVLCTHEPGGTPLGQTLRHLLKQGDPMPPISELMLFEAARAQLVDKGIRPFLRGGGVIIADRFTSSTTAYQGYGRGIDINFINQINDQVVKNIIPDLIFYMDINWEEKKNRKGLNVKDRFEKEDRNFHNKVRSGNHTLAKKDLDKWKIIDAEEDVNKISSFIYETVKSKLNI